MRIVRRAALAALVAVVLLAPGSGAIAAQADDRPATTLRVTLGQLLGEHAFLLMETMRAASLGNGEEAALRVGLDDCTDNIRDAIASIYGDAGGDAFAKLWQDHIDLLIAYSEAGSEGDEAAQQQAQEGLDKYIEDLSTFLQAANPEFRAEDEAAALSIHVNQLTAFIDSNFEAAFQSQRDAYRHMFHLGDHLALGIARQFPDRFPDGAVAFSPRTDLRLTLDRLLGEHLVLAAQVMRAGVTDAPDFAAGATAIEGNTTDLADAVASVYGTDAGSAFATLWRAHIDAYVEYVRALAAGELAAQDAALAALHGYHDRLAQFLASANPELSADAVATLVQRHVQALISQAEATAEGDYERAVATTREAYAGMFEVGAALADAIVLQFPDRFEDLKELPGTSTAGRAMAMPSPAPAVAAGIILLAAAALLGLRQMRTPNRRR